MPKIFTFACSSRSNVAASDRSVKGSGESETKITIDNTSDPKYTVIKVETSNRPGLLTAITATFRDLVSDCQPCLLGTHDANCFSSSQGIDVARASVDGKDDCICDTFLVNETNGGKVPDRSDLGVHHMARVLLPSTRSPTGHSCLQRGGQRPQVARACDQGPHRVRPSTPSPQVRDPRAVSHRRPRLLGLPGSVPPCPPLASAAEGNPWSACRMELSRYTRSEDKKELLYNLMDTYIKNDVLSIQEDIVNHVEYTIGRSRYRFDDFEAYMATSYSVRDRLIEAWNDTNTW